MSLTKQDLRLIEDVVDTKLEQKLEEKLEEKLQFLPTKDEFYTKMDEVMGELQAIHEEVTVIGYRVSQHSDQIATLENTRPLSP